MSAISSWVGSRAGRGKRTAPSRRSGCSGMKVTSNSAMPEIARPVCATARLKGSEGFSALTSASREDDVCRRLGQFFAEAALIELRHGRALELVALVEKGHAERKSDVAENLRVLRPGDDRARAHDRGEVAIDEGAAREIGHPHHRVDGLAAL